MASTTSLIKDNILYPITGIQEPVDYSQHTDKPFIEYYFDTIRKNLAEKGDRVWITNGAKKALGTSRVFGPASYQLGQVEARSRLYARVLHHVYNIRHQDVVHLFVPSTTEFYFPVLGTWILQGLLLFK